MSANGATTGVCGGNVRPRQAEERSGQCCHKRKTDGIKDVFISFPNFSATLPKSARDKRHTVKPLAILL